MKLHENNYTTLLTPDSGSTVQLTKREYDQLILTKFENIALHQILDNNGYSIKYINDCPYMLTENELIKDLEIQSKELSTRRNYIYQKELDLSYNTLWQRIKFVFNPKLF